MFQIKQFVFVFLSVCLSAQAWGVTKIKDCGTRITEPGDYLLARNLDCSHMRDPLGISIEKVRGVRLDLGGFDIKGRAAVAGYANPSGVGILIKKSKDVSIVGNYRSKISLMHTAVKVMGSKDIKLTGKSAVLKGNGYGVQLRNSSHSSLSGWFIEENRVLDVYLVGLEDSTITKNYMRKPGTPATDAIMLDYSEDILIKSNKIGSMGSYAAGILVLSSPRIEIGGNEIQRANYGVLLSHSQTVGTEFRFNNFGNPQENNCDYRVQLGAQQPELVGNLPTELNNCTVN